MILHRIGTALPAYRIAQDALAENLYGNSLVQGGKAIFRMTGVHARHTVLTPPEQHIAFDLSQPPTTGMRMKWYEQHAPPLALQAAEDAFRTSRLPPTSVTHLITASCTGFSAPGVDLTLIESLGLATDVARTHVAFHGCHGAFNALRVAKAFADSSPRSVILVVCVELCSLHIDPREGSESIVANGLFADGAGAVICTHSGVDGIRLCSTTSQIIPETRAMMSWTIRENGFQMGLSPRVAPIIEREIHPCIIRWLSIFDLDLQSIHAYAIHPGGPRILDACQRSLGLAAEDLHLSRKVLQEMGNMSSATILFILHALLQSNVLPPFVAIGFGPGLTMEALLFDGAP